MSEQTGIEWTDHSWSPWWGCTKVSEACAHCYAASWAKWTRGIIYAAGQPRVRTKDWKAPLRWNRKAAEFPWMCPACKFRIADGSVAILGLECSNCRGSRLVRYRPRVFPSMMDWLDEEVPVEWLADFLMLVRATPNLDWLLLTKRPGNFERRLREVLDLFRGPTNYANSVLKTWITNMLHGWAGCTYTAPEVGRENYWIGATVENQRWADERIPALLRIPARVRFLSCEPLLGPVDVLRHIPVLSGDEGTQCFDSSALHWVIAGGESGPHARPSHPDWFRGLRDQCGMAGMRFFFKQWGEWWVPSDREERVPSGVKIHTFDDGEPQFQMVFRVGKKRAGRLLDGREWDEVPV